MSSLPHLFDLSERVAIVTGGVGLLGTEFCKTLAEAGAAVMVADLNGEAARNLAASLTQIGFRISSHETDVTSPDSVKELVMETIKAFGRLDILVNSAALDPKFDPHSSKSHSGAFESYPVELWQQALDVNLTGAMLCCQAAVQPMLEQGSGTIINLSSIIGAQANAIFDYELDLRDFRKKELVQAFDDFGRNRLKNMLIAEMVITFILVVVFTLIRANPILLVLWLVGIALGYFYSAPPLRIKSRSSSTVRPTRSVICLATLNSLRHSTDEDLIRINNVDLDIVPIISRKEKTSFRIP